MDLATFAGLNYRDFTIGGATYRVVETKVRHWAEFQAFLKAAAPGPLARLRADDLAGLDAATKAAIVNRAYEENRVWPPRLASPGWFAAIETAPHGNAELVRCLLKQAHPDLSTERADALAEQLDLATVVEMISVALGCENDPKSAASPARPVRLTPPRTRRRRRR